MTKTSLSYLQFCRHFLILLAYCSGCFLTLNCLYTCDIQRCYQSVTMDLEVLDNITGFSHFFPPEAMWTRRKHLRTWTSFYCALMKLLMQVLFLKLLQIL
uniref:Transmembrane protein n=2 Tax=Medicago truncatula TaxID=3880 RepID=I3SG22_MEDTR|nr:unknown [Medicago truncatula]